MTSEVITWTLVSVGGILSVWKLYFQKRKEAKIAKEDTSVKYEGKRINQAELSFFRYLYFVYFVRSKLRPASTLLFWLCGFMVGCMFMYVNFSFAVKPVLKVEEMPTAIGIIKKIQIGKKGPNILTLLHQDGTSGKYSIGIPRKEKKLLFSKIGKEVKVYYQNRWRMFNFEDAIFTIEENGKIIKGERFKHNYQRRLDRREERFSNIGFWAKYNLVFLVWMFYFNYKEKPIHRLNRIRKLKGKQMAM